MKEELRNEIVRRWQSGTSQRAIARRLRVSRGSVQRALSRYHTARSGKPETAQKRPGLLDPYAQVIEELVGRYPDLTVTRLLEELRSRGFSGGYTIVRQRLRALRPRAASQPVIRFETGPGAQAQMDYSPYDLEFSQEERRRVYAFSYLLSYSRRQYLLFVEAQDFDTTLQQHVRAFEHLGGVAATCLYDNMKVVVRDYEGDVPLYNPRFLAFATHYGFRPVACRPFRPQTKGKVERQFFYAEKNLLNGRTFRSLAHLNEVTADWLANVADMRVHRETNQSPRERHALELPHLILLPANHYEVAPVVYRTVTVEGFVVWRQNHYSVPWRHLGQVLPVRITGEELIVYGSDLREVARHSLLSRTISGKCSLQPEHHPARDASERWRALRERYEQLGPVAIQFLEGLSRTQRYYRDQAQRTLGLLATYSQHDWLAALERAVQYGAYAAAAVERVLAAQARPKSLTSLLAEDERRVLPSSPEDQAAVEPRPTSEYQPLLPQEPCADEPRSEPPSEIEDAPF
jgi:transposase